MLGLALVHTSKTQFEQIADTLGRENILPFSADYQQCKHNDPKAKTLLELTLKACLIAMEIEKADLVIRYAHNHNYRLLSLDEQTVQYMVKQTSPGNAFPNDFRKLTFLIEHELVYREISTG